MWKTGRDRPLARSSRAIWGDADGRRIPSAAIRRTRSPCPPAAHLESMRHLGAQPALLTPALAQMSPPVGPSPPRCNQTSGRAADGRRVPVAVGPASRSLASGPTGPSRD